MVKKKSYTPDRGDVVWIEFSPKVGREQAYKRPALVLSPKAYNEKVGLALMCPITSQVKGYPFEILCKENKINGAVLTDQIRSMDWKARKVSFIQKVPPRILRDVQEKIAVLIAG